jgi:hypothetical protein
VRAYEAPYARFRAAFPAARASKLPS